MYVDLTIGIVLINDELPTNVYTVSSTRVHADSHNVKDTLSSDQRCLLVVFKLCTHHLAVTDTALFQPPFSIFGLHNFNKFKKHNLIFSKKKKNVSTSLHFVFHRNSVIIATQSMPYLIHLQGGS